MREAQAHLKTPYFVLSGNVKPGYYDFLPPNQATPNGFKSQWVEPKSGIKVPYSSNTIWGSAENLGLMDAGPNGSSTSLSGDSQGVLTLNSASSSPPMLAQISPSRVADPRAGPGLAYKSYQRVHVPQGLMGEFLSLAQSNTTNNLETCGLLGGSMENGPSLFFVGKQESTSYSCETKNEGEILAVQQKHSLTILGWIHTHPTQACFMSSVDLHTQYSYQILLRDSIGIVMAPTDNQGLKEYFISRIPWEQTHKAFFGKSDLFFVCMLKPLSLEINAQESEIEAAQWMPWEEYTKQPFVQNHELLRYMTDICSAKTNGDYEGFTPLRVSAPDQQGTSTAATYIPVIDLFSQQTKHSFQFISKLVYCCLSM